MTEMPRYGFELEPGLPAETKRAFELSQHQLGILVASHEGKELTEILRDRKILLLTSGESSKYADGLVLALEARGVNNPEEMLVVVANETDKVYMTDLDGNFEPKYSYISVDPIDVFIDNQFSGLGANTELILGFNMPADMLIKVAEEGCRSNNIAPNTHIGLSTAHEDDIDQPLDVNFFDHSDPSKVEAFFQLNSHLFPKAEMTKTFGGSNVPIVDYHWNWVLGDQFN